MKLALVIILLALVAWAAFCFQDRLFPGEGAHIARVEPDFNAIGSAVKAYKINGGHYPTTEQGLEALVTRPSTEPLPARWMKIADAVPKDAWNHPYHYRLLSQDGVPAFEITSAGKDGILGTTDDLSSLHQAP